VFERWPQALPIMALAIISLVGLIAGPARPSFHRELGAIFGAAAIVVSSTVMLYRDSVSGARHRSWRCLDTLGFDFDMHVDGESERADRSRTGSDTNGFVEMHGVLGY